MAEEKVTILDVQVNAQAAIKTITEYRAKIDQLKSALKEEEQQNGKNTQQAEVYRAEIAALNKDLRENVKQLGNQVTQQREQEGSLVSMRARLSELTSAYDRLSKEERQNTEVGGAMMHQINQLTDEIKSNEEATQRYYRNVGNYTESIRKAMGANNKYVMGLQAMSDVFGKGLVNGIKTTTSAISAMSKQLLTLLANPVVAILAAIAAAFMVLKKGIESSEENTQAFNKALAPLKGVFDVLIVVIQKITSVMLKFVQVHIDAAMAVSKFLEKIPLIGGAFKEVNTAIERQTEAARLNSEVQKEERDQMLKNAATENKVAKLRDKVAQTQKYSAKERRAYLVQAMKLERQEADQKIALEKKKLKAMELEAKTTDNVTETNRKLTEQKAKLIQLDTEYLNLTRRQQSQLASLDQQERSKQEAAAKEREERAKKAAEEARRNALERKKNEAEAFRTAQDAVLAILYETAEKRREALRIQYEREIADLKERLKTEKNLTAKAREDINKTILAKQIQYNQESEKLRIEAIQQQVAQKTQEIQSELSVAEKGSKEQLDLQKQLNAQETAQKVAQLAEQLRTMQITQEQFAVQSENVREAERQKNAQLDEQYETAQFQRRQQALQNQLAQLQLNGEAALEKEREIAQQSLDDLIARGQLSSQTREQFDAEVIAKRQEVANKEKAIDDAKLKHKEAVANAEKAVMNSVMGLMEQMGEENKTMAKLSKVLALANIAFNTGEAIAEGVKQAQKLPYPTNIPAIATTVATVLANITSAISTVKAAKFATGGKVNGPGTGTSDSIPAMLSNGEFVMTAKATRMFEPLLAAMNGIGAGIPMQVAMSGSANDSTDRMREAFGDAVKEIRPVVSVVDINEGQQRVEAIQNLDSL